MILLALIATEILAVKHVTTEGDARNKAHTVRCATSPALFLQMLRAKAQEAGLAWLPTRTVKPSQTCSTCGRQERTPLAQRVHRCACGTVLGRDENAARVMLNCALSAWPGAGQVWRDRRSGPVEANFTWNSCSGGEFMSSGTHSPYAGGPS
ncbi:MAG TPA: zinc ribbon domain-containing protein [Anaeromyxobacteraceae bacterium]|nr:zinc ribbon domain-containing protein [Anaeromyxobacteraceae bacterium]